MDEMKFEIYEDGSGAWRWRAIATNGEIMGDSGQGYTRKHDAERARDRFIELVKAMQ